ncbi:thiamine phosphate synthase [Candidatus Kirkpatrickella diaphorinae]|uniref:Thiamine phosphate synthase n=1 Tax=Candidatus Kirkpatrickella diaphorinae TaxID=2984322 RepID=A0ABY6GIH1_9PROT|nr:thiamine phosphate synthase [Candidatus Kirkpatrickella diaphorinae]UYH51305.1 thiamine phosphate synthase [Candidatus Kirkpatrickella diaphorinae]
MHDAIMKTELYLAATLPFSSHDALTCFTSILDRYQPAAFCVDFDGEAQIRQQVEAIRETCLQNNVALMLKDWPEGVAALGCDGVHISNASGPIDMIRKRLPADTQLGVFCGGSRDTAMQAGEAGADYIAINADQTDLAAWWMEMTELPLVCENIETANEVEALTRLGVDFLLLRLDFNAPFATLCAQLSALGIPGR